MKTYLSPSILSADFTGIADAVKAIEQGGADWIHCDVMDGVFVPNISFGQKAVSDIKKAGRLFVDAHLMITQPERYVDEFAKAADLVTFHIEATDKPLYVIERIKKQGKKVGLSIKPGTDVEAALPFIGLVDLILVMSVEPGFGGQRFMPSALMKIERLRQYAGKTDIQVDGGINLENMREVVKRGANSVVVGSAIFSDANPAKKTAEFKRVLNEAEGCQRA